ncbi:MAG: GIY-YIG nuclease family protein [Xanthobacteraceae bacterium]|nr:GIY-YIG nuclease family protein [Xanthobacteraceae bacterium]
MPFTIRISRCWKGHELTIYADPVNDEEINLTWTCEECAAERKAAEKPKTSSLRDDEAVGGGGDEPCDVVRTEEETQIHHVYELIDGRDGGVFYVGVTINPDGRFYSHGMPNSPSAALPRIQEIRQNGGEYHMRIVASFKDRTRAEAYEVLLISETTGAVNRMKPPLRSLAG